MNFSWQVTFFSVETSLQTNLVFINIFISLNDSERFALIKSLAPWFMFWDEDYGRVNSFHHAIEIQIIDDAASLNPASSLLNSLNFSPVHFNVNFKWNFTNGIFYITIGLYFTVVRDAFV